MKKKIYIKIFVFSFIFVTIFFNKIILTDLTYFQRDIILQFKPWKILIKDFLKNINTTQQIDYLDIIPLWNHYNYCGYPFLANPQTQVFYPFSIIFYILNDFVLGYKIFIILHFLLAFIFMFMLLRSKKIKIVPAILGSIVWSFNGYIISRIEFLSVLATIVWLPLIIFLFDKIKTIKLKKIILFSIIISIQFLAGHTQMWFYSMSFLLFYAIYKCLEQKTNSYILTFIIAIILSSMISAVQLLPTLEFFIHSIRAGEDIKNFGLKYEDSKLGSLSLKDLINFIYPFNWKFYFQNTSSKWVLTITNYWWYTFYVGAISIVLFFIGIIKYKNLKEKIFYISLTCLIIFYALGDNFFFFKLLYKILPLIRVFRYPATALYIILFIICLFASYGLQYLTFMLPKYKKFLYIITIFCFFELYFYNLEITMLLPKSILKEKNEITNSLIKKYNQDLFKFRFMLTPLTQKLATTSYGNNLYEAIANYRDKLFGNINIEYKLFNFQGQDIELKNYVKFKNFVYSRKSLDEAVPFLSIANVKYIMSAIEQKNGYLKLVDNLSYMKIYENPYALPIIYPVENIILETNLEKSLEIMGKLNKDILNTSIVHNCKLENYENFLIRQRTSNVILHNIKYMNNKIAIKLTTYKQTFFVLSKNFYPGWKCKIDNKHTKIYHTNIFMSGILVPEGTHEVLFYYSPLTFKIGTILTLATIFLSIVLLFEKNQ